MLLKAAKRLESLDLDLARETYLSAWMGRDLRRAVSRARASDRGLPCRPGRVRGRLIRSLAAMVLDALTMLVIGRTGRRGAACAESPGVFLQREASRPKRNSDGAGSAQAAASALWDDVPWRAMLLRQVQLARDVGALDQLPVDLASLGTAIAWTGDLAGVLGSGRGGRCGPRRDREPAPRPSPSMLLRFSRATKAKSTPLIEAAIADGDRQGGRESR